MADPFVLGGPLDRIRPVIGGLAMWALSPGLVALVLTATDAFALILDISAFKPLRIV